MCNLLERSMYMFWWNIVESSVKHLNPNPINSDVSISKFYFNNGIIIFFWQDKPQQNENITAVVNKLFDEGHLIADGSKPYSLPTIVGKHGDLTSITSETVSNSLYTHIHNYRKTF